MSSHGTTRRDFIKQVGTVAASAAVVPGAAHARQTRQEPNLPAQLGYQAMAAIGMGVQAYRQHQVVFFDRRTEKVTVKPTS